jgi:hypothetical protein
MMPPRGEDDIRAQLLHLEHMDHIKYWEQCFSQKAGTAAILAVQKDYCRVPLDVGPQELFEVLREFNQKFAVPEQPIIETHEMEKSVSTALDSFPQSFQQAFSKQFSIVHNAMTAGAELRFCPGQYIEAIVAGLESFQERERSVLEDIVRDALGSQHPSIALLLEMAEHGTKHLRDVIKEHKLDEAPLESVWPLPDWFHTPSPGAHRHTAIGDTYQETHCES